MCDLEAKIKLEPASDEEKSPILRRSKRGKKIVARKLLFLCSDEDEEVEEERKESATEKPERPISPETPPTRRHRRRGRPRVVRRPLARGPNGLLDTPEAMRYRYRVTKRRRVTASPGAPTWYECVRCSTQAKEKLMEDSLINCELCDMELHEKTDYPSHMQVTHNVMIPSNMQEQGQAQTRKCVKCDCRFFTMAGLKRHLLCIHGLASSSMRQRAKDGEDNGRCVLCSDLFDEGLLEHLQEEHYRTIKTFDLVCVCNVCAFGKPCEC